MLAGVVALVAFVPKMFRQMDAFRVERVEIMGTRYLPPHEALRQSGITKESSIFDDPEPWLAALRAHPLVADARIERELPGTLVLMVVEVEPVALVRTPELRPVSGEGRVLPIDPVTADLDLPIVTTLTTVGEDGRLADSVAIAMVRTLDRIRRHDPSLSARISEIGPLDRGSVRLVFRDSGLTEALLPAEPERFRLEQLRVTLADLGARREFGSVRRIDVRFKDQVVVSMNSTADR